MRPPVWLLVGLVLALCPPVPADSLRAGVAREVLRLPRGVPLGGYLERKGAASRGTHDPITATALVLDDGRTRVGLVAVDAAAIDPRITRRAARLARFPESNLLIAASHTHSGPGAYGRGLLAHFTLGPYRDDVASLLARTLARAVRRAQRRQVPATLAFASGDLPALVVNRRHSRFLDSSLSVLRVDRADGSALAAVAVFGAHGTVLGPGNRLLSGDWMGAGRRAMERRAPGLTVLYLNGAEGDQAPAVRHGHHDFQESARLGEVFAEAALGLYESAPREPDSRLSVRFRRLPLPRTARSRQLSAGSSAPLQVIRVGGALLMAFPGEPAAELALALKDHARRQEAAMPVVVGLANSYLGYFLSRRDIERGGYEAGQSFYGEAFGEKLTLELGRVVGGNLVPLRKRLRTGQEE